MNNLDPTSDAIAPDALASEALDLSDVPLVTVGLAVYNGGRHVAEAIESILTQTFADFELVICDNASTDLTATICARFAARDRRVRYYRNPYNIGGVRNENRTMFLARGKYFLLAAHDDRIDKVFLARCVSVLEEHSDVEVCITGVTSIDGAGDVTGIHLSRVGCEAHVHHRIRAISDLHRYSCEATYGLMRTTALRAVRPQANRLHSDRVFLCELSLRKPFYLIEDPLFFKRHHTGNMRVDWRAHSAWFEPDLKRTGGLRFPHWRHALDYLSMLERSGLGPLVSLRCYFELSSSFWRMRRNLAMDLIDGLRMVLAGRAARRRRYTGI